MRRKAKSIEPGALQLIEESFHLLRGAPAGVWVLYYAGSLPFVLGLLFFWAEMSSSAWAHERLTTWSLGLGALFLWMKTWQTFFARALRGQLEEGTRMKWRWREVPRVFVRQAALQPSGLFLLPLAALVAAPFGWVYTFYQNVTALGALESEHEKSLFRRAVDQATLWPGQNHLALGVLSLFGFFMFLNLALALFQGPQLIKTLLGVETIFTWSNLAFLNSTFLLAALGLAYLCADPFIKAISVLRCFWGDSIRSGADIQAAWRWRKGSNPFQVN